MLTADHVLTAIRAAGLPIDGVTLRDVSKVETWTFYGEKATPDDIAAAVRIVQGILSEPPKIDPIVQLRSDLDSLQTEVSTLAAAVAANTPPPSSEPKSP